MRLPIRSLPTAVRAPVYQRTLAAPHLARFNPSIRVNDGRKLATSQSRGFATTQLLELDPAKYNTYENSNARPAEELDHNITQEEKDDFERKIAQDRSKQIRTPWQREGSDIPPVARQRSAGAMTKGTTL
jgi:calcium uniporter protein, mitochondrial